MGGRCLLDGHCTVAVKVLHGFESQGDGRRERHSVQIYGKADIPMIIPSSAFYPEPKVDSAVVRVELYDEPLIPLGEMDAFFALAKAGFGQKRKTLRNALSSNLHLSAAETASRLEQAGIDPMRRAETLSIEEWKRMMEVFPQDPADLPSASLDPGI